MPFKVDTTPWLHAAIDESWLQENLSWKDFGNGSRLGKLAREDGVGLVVYHVADDADPNCFQPHTHTGGEMYLVLKGEVEDEDGTYPAGSLVWMKPGSRHTPRTHGDTYILTLWPGGVEA